MYVTPGQSLNPDNKGRTRKNTAKQCRNFCEKKFPDEAKFFSWNKADFEKKGNQRVCRCKKNNKGEQRRESVISGNLFCSDPTNTPLSNASKASQGEYRSDYFISRRGTYLTEFGRNFLHDPLYVCHMSHAKRNTPTNMNNQPMCLFTISFQIGTKLLKGKTMKTLVTE